MKKIFLSFAILSSFVVANTLEQIQSSKSVRIGVRYKLPPFSNQDENNNPEGFEVELAKAVGKALVGDGGKIELVILNAKERVEMLESKKSI